MCNNYVQQALSISRPWAWGKLALIKPEAVCVKQVMEEVPYGSSAHTSIAKKLNHELNLKRCIHYHYLVKVLAVCISGFMTEVSNEK